MGSTTGTPATTNTPAQIPAPTQATISKTTAQIASLPTPPTITMDSSFVRCNIGTVVNAADLRNLASLGLTQGVTRTDFGPGITVVSLTVTSSGSATAVINIAPDAPAGARTVTLTTASISGTATFTVDRAQP